MREKAILTYSGVLDTDTDHKFVKPEDHIAAKNLYSTVTEKGGTKFVMPGTVQVESDLTDSFVITGVFEEKTTNKIYYLVYNPAGADRVYVYDPLDQSSPNGVTRELCRLDGLDLDPDFLAQGDIVDGKYLIWCESNQIKNTLEHNGIKKINLDRADVNKRFVYRLAVTQESEGSASANLFADPPYSSPNWLVNNSGFAAVTENAVANPVDGSVNAALLYDSAVGTNLRAIVSSQTIPLIANDVYTISMYAKAAGNGYISGEMWGASGLFMSWNMDLSTGLFATASTSSVYDYTETSEDVGGGWWKITIQFTPNVSVPNMNFVVGGNIDATIGYPLYAGTPTNGIYIYAISLFPPPTGEGHYYKIFNVNGVEVVPETLFYDGASEGSIQARLEAIATALDAVTGIGAVAFPNYVEITMDTAGQRLLVYSDAATTQSGLTDWPDAKYNGQSLLFWAYNHYPLAATRDMFDLCKRPMPCAPFHEFQENPDPLDKIFNTSDGAWQFITRLHFIDGEVSAWSEPSIISSNNVEEEQEYPMLVYDEVGESDTVLVMWNSLITDITQKLIVMRYANGLVIDEIQLSLISHIEIAVREGETSPYYQIEKMPIEDCIADVFSFTFRNDRKGGAISSDDATSDINTQVLKKFDWVPIGAGAIGLIDEEGGNGKIIIGAPSEGYDNIQKADCEIEFVFSEDASNRVRHHHLKERGEYKVGIEYLDDFGRTSDVIHALDLTVPDHHIPGSRFNFRVYEAKMSIRHTPPSWATKYRIVRTRNLLHRDFYQFITFRGYTAPRGDWKYIIYDEDKDEKFEETSITDSSHFAIKLPVEDGSTVGEYVVFNDLQLNSFFTPQKGDRIRILRNVLREVDVLDPIPDEPAKYISYEDADFPILALHTDINGNQWAVTEKFTQGSVIAPSGNWFATKAIFICEVYRPKATEEFVYLETGNCYDIIEDGGNYYHDGDIQAQTDSDPCILEFHGGDTMWKGTNPYARMTLPQSPSDVDIFFTIETPYASEYGLNKCESVGRANLEDVIESKYVFNRFRFSQIYQTNSKINGLNSFRPSDLVDLNITFGPVSGLKMSGDTLMAICFNKCQPIYLNRETVLNVDSAGQLGTSARAFNFASELRGDYGCQNKESILVEHGNIYAWDKRTGTIWRYDANGINDIRQKTVSIFGEIGDYRKDTLISSDRVFTGYDRRRDKFFIYFAPVVGVGSCWVYDEKANGWVGQIEMSPQMFSMVNDKLLSFSENQLYVHDGEGAIYANIYGEQVVPEITKVFNQYPTIDKIPWTAAIKASKRWDFSIIETPPSLHFKEGQESRILGDRWRNLSGTWTAAFLRDMRDTSARFLAIPNLTTRERTALLSGRHLRGDHFVITLRLPDPEADALFSTEIEYSKPE